MREESSIVEKIAQHGWRQGAVLPDHLVAVIRDAKHIPYFASPSDKFLVISQDCDVVCKSLVAEPKVELLRAKVGQQANKNFAWNKSSRQLHIQFQVGDLSHSLELSIHDRFQIPRERLAESKPDDNFLLPKRMISQLALWVSRRYVRPAFPDEFVRRLEQAKKKIKAGLAREEAQFIDSIQILVDDEELAPETPYKIFVFGLMHEDDFDDSTKRTKAFKVWNAVQAAFECPGIEVEECELLSEKDVAISALRKLKRFDLDDLTLREDADASKAIQAPGLNL